MSSICALGFSALHQGICRSNIRCSSTTAKFAPFAPAEGAQTTERSRLELAFNLDANPNKINLGGCLFRNALGKPYVFQAVRRAAVDIACDDTLSQEPQPPLGNPAFTQAANELVLNKQSTLMAQNRVLGIQTRSAEHALHLAARFLQKNFHSNHCLLASPCPAHLEGIFKRAGFCCANYRFCRYHKVELDIYGLVADLMTAPERAIILLDACAHNPTGICPSIDEWKLIAHIIKCKKMIPIFSLANHGLASGDPIQDSWPVRYFAENDFDFLCVQSFAQNFGLYNECLGHLMVVLGNGSRMDAVQEQFKDTLLNNGEQGSSLFISRIVARVLETASLRKDWALALKELHQNMRQMRLVLSNKLEVLKTPGNWAHLKNQQGPHIYTHLKLPQLKELRCRHIYVPNSGRINAGALAPGNVDYVAGALNEVILSAQTAAMVPPTINLPDSMQQLKAS